MAGYLGLAAIAGVIWFLLKFARRKRIARKKRILGPLIILGGTWYFLFTYVTPVAPGHAVVDRVVHGPVHGGTLGCGALERLWIRAGGSPSAAFMAAEIARAESGGRQYARDPLSGTYTDGTVDEGYFQINTVHGNLATYDPYGNARAAVIISNNGRDWSAWVTWKKGLEVGQC